MITAIVSIMRSTQTRAAGEVGVLAVSRPGPRQVVLYLRLDPLDQVGAVRGGVREHEEAGQVVTVRKKLRPSGWPWPGSKYPVFLSQTT